MNRDDAGQPDTPNPSPAPAATPAGIAMTITRVGDATPGLYFRTHQATVTPVTPVIPAQRTGDAL